MKINWNALAILGVACLAYYTYNNEDGYSSKMNQDEINFIDSNKYLKDRYGSAKNDLQAKNEVKFSKEYFCNSEVIPSVQGWVGKVSNIDETFDGRAILAIKINKFITIETWNNFLSDASDKTTIEKNSSVYSNLYNVAVGQEVKFSGVFIKDSDGCLLRSGMPDEVSFVFRFSEVVAN